MSNLTINRRSALLGLAGMVAARDAFSQSNRSAPAAAVRSILETRADYLESKVALDRIIDPSTDSSAATNAVQRLAGQTRSLAGDATNDVQKLAAVRRVLYVSGPWNEGRPFEYDHADPFGHDTRNKLLATYLRTRRGNCVSMPVLYLIMAEKLGVPVSLAQAPHHLLIRWREPNGHEVNFETTSGGMPARDEWYRQTLPPITDEAIANGVYLRTLSRRENVAAMATTVAEYFFRSGRYQEAIDVAQVILEYAPHDAQTIVLQASCYGQMIHDQFETRFPTPNLIPAGLIARYQMLSHINETLFARAEALGWRQGAD